MMCGSIGKNVLIPCTDATSGSQTFCDRHALLLTPTDATNGVISNGGSERMAQTKDRCQHAGKQIGELFTRLAPARSRCTCRCSEGQCFADGERGEMDVVFGAVLDVASEVFVKLLRGDRVVVYIAVDGVVFLPLIGKCFEEGAAS